MSVHLSLKAKRFLATISRNDTQYSYVFVYLDLYEDTLSSYLSGHCRSNLVHRAKARLYREISYFCSN